MTNIMRRSLPLLAAALFLSSCGTGADKASTAATVGGTDISMAAVQSDARWLAKNVPEIREQVGREPGKGMAALNRRVAQNDIQHELVEAASQREGLKADAVEVDRFLQLVGGEEGASATFAVTPAKVRRHIEDFVKVNELAERSMDKVSVSVVGGLIAAESASDPAAGRKAERLAEKIAADPGQAKQLGAAEATQPLDETLVMGNPPELAATPLFTADEGSVVSVQLQADQQQAQQQGSAYVVALITDRKVDAKPKKKSSQQEDPTALYAAGVQQLAPTAERIGVELNPRLGSWNAASAQISANADDVRARVLAPKAQ